MADGGKKKRHIGRNIGLAILLILIVGGAAFYFLYLSGGETGAVYRALTNSSALGTLVTQQIASAPQLGVAYSGSITSNVTNLQGIDPQATLPFTAKYMRYYNNTRVEVSFMGDPEFGINNLSAIGISLDNGSTVYVCYNLNGAGYTCKMSSGSPLQVVQNLTSAFNLSAISGFSVKQVYPSLYDGTPCWQVAGAFNVSGTGGILNGKASVSFSSCLSSKYYLPLYLNATIAPPSGAPTIISVQNTNMSTATSLSQISSLPGPVR